MPKLRIDRFSEVLVQVTFLFMMVVVISFIFIRFDELGVTDDIFTMFLLMIGVGSMALVIQAIFRASNKNPSLLLVSVIGYPNSGKTVYISVLFKEFINKQIKNIFFASYGQETTEEVTRNINTLISQKWLESTRIKDVFPFRAVASIGRGLYRRRFQIEVRDFAGEHFENSSSEKWLHRNKYFKNMAESDIIFFVIDGEELLEAIKSDDFSELNKTENSIIAALELIKQYKSVLVEKKLRAPVGLIFLKWDLIVNHVGNNTDNTDNTKTLKFDPQSNPFLLDLRSQLFIQNRRICEELISYCDSNCYNFQIFYVSSVGSVTKDGLPPKTLKPFNVTEPLVWAIETI